MVRYSQVLLGHDPRCQAGAIPLCGVDEAGRGPLAGPVVAAAVLWDPHLPPLPGLDDSKRLSPSERNDLFLRIREISLGFALARVEALEIDRLNILQASLAAMSRAVAALAVTPGFILVDGNRLPRDLPAPARAVVAGDGLCPAIAAASILAKVTRDAIMDDLATRYPGYGWERNRGYPTREHLEALARLGITDEHRRTFGPVKGMVSGDAK